MHCVSNGFAWKGTISKQVILFIRLTNSRQLNQADWRGGYVRYAEEVYRHLRPYVHVKAGKDGKSHAVN
jgi:hypothetical protein